MRLDDDTKEGIIYSYACDLCGKGYRYMRTCSICNIDICYDCTKVDPRNIGNFPEKYCVNCFKIGKKYLDLICAERKKFCVLIENLEQAWRYEVKEAKAREEKIVEESKS